MDWRKFSIEQPDENQLVIVFLKGTYLVANYSHRDFIKEWIPHDRTYSITCFLTDQWYPIDPPEKDSPCLK